ncbi:MAG: DUF411 domain-containing protein [Armatimonadota bacterium]|nr:DUF411 domain-containing protein [Armatimonadota bacterium]MDR7566109.1 DUF411 domain-containing protein [Armatimonadota bacterium]
MGRRPERKARTRGIWALAVVAAVAGLAVAWVAWQGSRATAPAGARLTVYQNPRCGCCGAYVSYLRGAGYAVEVVKTEDMEGVKRRYRVPQQLWSCHTAVAGRYFVEGHVPVEAVQELLGRAPDWLGIALPGMPSGSPGMSGPREGPLVVQAVTREGLWREFGRF